MVEAPGTAPGSEWFISTAIYRHSRQAGAPNIRAKRPKRKSRRAIASAAVKARAVLAQPLLDRVGHADRAAPAIRKLAASLPEGGRSVCRHREPLAFADRPQSSHQRTV